jgi:hypothetical protein
MVDSMIRDYFNEVHLAIKDAIEDAINAQTDVYLKLVTLVEGERHKEHGFGSLRAVIQSKSEVPGVFITNVLKNLGLGANSRDITWKHEGHSVFFDITMEYIRRKIMDFVKEDKENDKKEYNRHPQRNGKMMRLSFPGWLIFMLIVMSISIIVALTTSEVSGSQFKKPPNVKQHEGQFYFLMRVLHNGFLFIGKCMIVGARSLMGLLLALIQFLFNSSIRFFDTIDGSQAQTAAEENTLSNEDSKDEDDIDTGTTTTIREDLQKTAAAAGTKPIITKEQKTQEKKKQSTQTKEKLKKQMGGATRSN